MGLGLRWLARGWLGLRWWLGLPAVLDVAAAAGATAAWAGGAGGFAAGAAIGAVLATPYYYYPI